MFWRLSMRVFLVLFLVFSQFVFAKDTKELKAYYFICNNNFEFVASLQDGEAWLFLPDETLSFKAEDSKRCNKFVKGDSFFGIKNQLAYLKLDKNTYHCKNNPKKAVWERAKLQGYDFRAVGNEPGWTLLIAGDNISYNGDYGATKYRFKKANIDTNMQKKQTVFSADENGHKIRIKLEAKKCLDTMSDDSYETSVSLEIDGKKLRGCGMALH
jgi:uncharacterized membrane protein